MTDPDLLAWLDSGPAWPTQPFLLYPWCQIPDPDYWRERLRLRARGSDRDRAEVLRDLRQLRAVMATPLEPDSSPVANWNRIVPGTSGAAEVARRRST